ncbi:ATP synthase mitochondrial F1 complex assembly factor 2 [Dermatophagoides pteronyssinus]|uniref:ATP synthase mitochondrial F1 complex assembly factor 2 n=1 Tax=Dermatophagoides pteronyssinus TaxID=6956 RepID=A0ABQ8ITM9_DERPT|nr:ATP synthase mitochondrial F1 complex assembly factor 2 [Dermatophagoides pteronyssinus]
MIYRINPFKSFGWPKQMIRFSSSLSNPNIKRFYKNVHIIKSDCHEPRYEIILDKRKLKTPKGSVFYVQNEPLASMIATEWDSQKDKIIPTSMHLTSLVNTVIDNPGGHTIDSYVDKLISYLEFDTVCYRNSLPTELYELQTNRLDPIVQWFADQFKCSMPITTDVVSPEIDQHTLEIIRKYLRSFNEWSMVGIMYSTENLKSLILTCALIARQLSVEQAVSLSRIEENFQASRWTSVEYHHDIEQYNIESRVAAAIVFILLNFEKNYVSQKSIN